MDLGVSDDAGYDGYVKSKNKNLTSASVFWWPHGPSLKCSSSDVVQEISVLIRGFFENNSVKWCENFNLNRSQLLEKEVCQILQTIVFSFMRSHGSNISHVIEQYSMLVVQCSVSLRRLLLLVWDKKSIWIQIFLFDIVETARICEIHSWVEHIS